MSYLIKKSDKNNQIIYCDYDLYGYKFKPKRTPGVDLQINQIMVINNDMIDNILSTKFYKRFHNLVSVAMDIIDNDDEDTGQTAFVLGEIEKQRAIILNKYQNYITKEKEKEMLNKLRNLENALRAKIIEYQMNIEETKSVGKSR